jgi:RNA polymerase sigma factor (sigma-70 family)
MATGNMGEVIRHLRRTVLLRDGAGLTDGQLLERFISGREEAALEALVKRHSPMVWGVCRRTLRNIHDAEDAFQATFLVLVRKAASVVPKEMVGNWLYGVAHQTAQNVRATATRRRKRERQVTDMPEPATRHDNLWYDLQPLLDQELSRLPDKYRAAIVLCDLEGITRKEAARQLGVVEGTMASRLARARTMLAKRLARHGLGASGGALAAAVSQNAASASAPPLVLSSTIKAVSLVAAGKVATGAISAKVVALTEGVVRTMLLKQLKRMTVALTFLAISTLGVGTYSARSHSSDQPGAQKHGGQNPIDIPEKGIKRQAVQNKEDLAKKDMAALQGPWRLMLYEKNGEIIERNEEQATNGTWIEIKGNKITITLNRGTLASRFKIDPAMKPKWLDAVPEPVIVLGAIDYATLLPIPWQSIYELENDVLRICFDSTGVLKRPTEFKTTPKSGLGLFVLKREQKTEGSFIAPKATPKSQRFFGGSQVRLQAVITDADLKEIPNFKNLSLLDLSGTKVSDVGMKEVANLNKLLVLCLAGTNVTDGGLKELANLTNLSRLYLVGTQVTDEGVRAFQKAVPNCRIYRQPVVRAPRRMDLMLDVE